MSMNSSNQKEQFNVAYVCAMAAQAGLNHLPPVVDEDSVDLTLMGKGFSGKWRNPQIHLQLKCTSQDLVSGTTIKFKLPKKNYDDLRGNNVICPRYLVVLIVPTEKDKWISHQPQYMSLHNQCYWISIKDHPDCANKTKVTVDIPLTQRLTTSDLLHLMTQASNGIAL